MTETTATILAEMKPVLRAALGDRFSPEYVAGFVRRNRVRMESMLAPIVAACARSAVVEDVATTRRPTRSAKAPSFSELQAAALALTELRVKGAADSITKLRHQDVERVLRETPSDERRQVAYVLADQRPDLGSEIDEVMREVLHEPENWGEYGRQEIAKPGTRARREATAAEDAAERGRHREVFAEFEFDGTRCVIFLRSPGYRVRVTEGGLELDLDTVDGSDLSMKARESLSSMLGLPSSPGAIREGEALVSASLRDSIRQDNKWKAERVIYVFSLAARRIAAADVPVAPISTRAPTNAPSGRVNLSPAASRMLAKMTDGAWFLTFSRKATSSISAATELRDAGLAEITDHHNDEIRIALPMLTVENYERASTILNATHPEWGIKRFNRDPSDRGHHSYGTGSNSAVLFASDFAGWVVASWLPTVGEVAAEHVARGAYLDENRPGWRESKRAPPEVEWGGGLELAGTADSLTKTLDAMLPMIEEEERRDEGPKPVVMASLEAGGVVMLSPHGYLGTDLFRTYRDATARLQYVSFPRKGQRGTPSTVASAVLALERDGFEVRAATPDVVKSLIVTGGLDHALAVGPPPPVEAVARPSYRTSDPLLIARVQAMADDPPTSAIKYLLKTLGERGDLPLQVNDWKNGGKRSIDVAIEEGEQKVARKLARKPKAERLRADGGERPANGPNEEHAAQALIQLANMDPDKAREINDEGFSKSDVATGHALARRWEATGELTGDEWDWAVLVANKYRRQVGPLPEPTGKSKRQRSTAPEGEALSRIELDLLRALVAIRDEADRTDGDDDEAHAWARGAVVPDGKHVTAALIGRSVQVAGLTDGHYRRLSERGLLERRSTDLGGGLIRVRYSITPAGVAAIATAPPVDNRKVAVERQRSTASAKERLFIGIMPTGISYADRSREVDGDYARCAFLPFDTLALKVAPKCPKELLGLIEADAAAIIARRGEQFSISTSGHTVVLGSGLLDTDRIPESPIPKPKREPAQTSSKTIRRNTNLGKQILTAPAEVHAYSLNNGFSGSEVEVPRFVAMMESSIANGQDLSIRTGSRAGWYTVQFHSNLWYEVRLPDASAAEPAGHNAQARSR